MKVIIGTMNNLPEYCWNCPCCSSVGRCRADEERRKTSEYRPFWCPLHEEKEDLVRHSFRVSCDMCGKVIEREYLTTINDNLHICKDCDQWFTEHLTKSEREQLYTEVGENIYIAKRGRCGKTVDIEIIGDMLIDYYNKKRRNKK